MKILFTIPSLGTGGAEVLLRDLAVIFKHQGHDVDILVLLSEEDGFIAQALRANGIRILRCPNTVSKRYSVRGMVKNFIFIFKHLKRNQYHIIHTHLTLDLYCLAIFGYLFRKKLNLITTAHNTVEARRNNFWIKFFSLEKLVYKKYLRIICITKEVCTSLIKELPALASKCVVIENGIDLERFRHAYVAAPIVTAPLILCIGALCKRKGQDVLIRAMRLVKNGKLWVVGDGSARRDLEDIVDQLALRDKVFFLGKSDRVWDLMKEAVLYVQPSLYEGFGLAILEAMAAGIPVIASAAPGMNELVAGVGEFFPVGDEVALARIIERILPDVAMRSEMSKRSLIKAENYSINKTSAKYLKLYSTIIQGR